VEDLWGRLGLGVLVEVGIRNFCQEERGRGERSEGDGIESGVLW
jgi:hypothetical protein